jgi:hypothetical protein
MLVDNTTTNGWVERNQPFMLTGINFPELAVGKLQAATRTRNLPSSYGLRSSRSLCLTVPKSPLQCAGINRHEAGSSRQGCESCEAKVLVPSIACIRTVSISGACGGNEARSARM